MLNDTEYSINQCPIIRVNNNVGAVAGVMGTAGTEVTHATTEIVLESAIFNAVETRRATKQLGLRSESSNRFEKGVDITQLNQAVEYVIELLSSNNNGPITIHNPVTFGNPMGSPLTIAINDTKINQLLGKQYTLDEIDRRLAPLGFTLDNGQLTVPSWRSNDCRNWPDIAEELIRFDGMSRIESRPIKQMVPINHSSDYTVIKHLRKCCIHQGLTEVIPFPLAASDINQNQAVIINPISTDLTVLRSNGIQGLLQCAAYNESRHSHSIEYFQLPA